MNAWVRIALALVVYVACLPAIAYDESRPYLYSGYEYTFRDDARNSSGGHGFNFGGGAALNQFWGLEAGIFADDFEGEASRPAQWKSFGVELGAMFFYSRNPDGMPYVELLVGGIRNDRESEPRNRSADPMAAAGIGFFRMFDILDRDVGLRADLRYRWSDARDLPEVGDFGEPQIHVGVVMALGPKPGAATTVATGAADSDRDSVDDDADQCPNTPAGTRVDAKGCPANDADHDGVADDVDRCPGTSSGSSVDRTGCPIGEKPGAQPGAKSPAKPARSADDIEGKRFEDVHFEFDRATVTAYGKALLDSAASTIGEMMRKDPGVRVELSGHTDWKGTSEYNQALSERRANAVKEYLVRKGVNASHISTFAYGETKPVADNETDEGRALNRRTEVRTTGE